MGRLIFRVKERERTASVNEERTEAVFFVFAGTLGSVSRLVAAGSYRGPQHARTHTVDKYAGNSQLRVSKQIRRMHAYAYTVPD